jgi:initiation factor 1A
MPNMTGGKKYRSGFRTQQEPELHEVNEAEGQMIGRVVKALGDRNMLIFCNDNRERICHIRGGLCKRRGKVRIEVGDIVLISLRGTGVGSSNQMDRGDILDKFDRDLHKKLQKSMPGANPRLFTNIESLDSSVRASDKTANELEYGFEFDNDATLDDDTDSEEREANKTTVALKRSAARDVKQNATAGNGGGDDVDIDAI